MPRLIHHPNPRLFLTFALTFSLVSQALLALKPASAKTIASTPSRHVQPIVKPHKTGEMIVKFRDREIIGWA